MLSLEEAVAKLKDDNVHEMILEPNQLISWLEELLALRAENTTLKQQLDSKSEELDRV